MPGTAPHSFSIFFARANILSLPNETLIEIANYVDLEPRDMRSMLCSSRQLAGAAEHVRYGSVVVSSRRGQLLLSTLGSGTHTAMRYCQRVRRLWFRGWHDCEMFLNADLLSEALPLMVNLTTLWIEASPIDTVHLMERLDIEGLLRVQEHPAFTILKPTDQNYHSSLLNLQNLKVVRLSGEFGIHKIVCHRALVELDFNCIMDTEEFATFLSSVDGTILGRNLKLLSLRTSSDIDLNFGIPLLSQAFPNLGGLCFEQACMKFPNFLAILADDSNSLKNIKYILINERLSHPLLALSHSSSLSFPPLEEMDGILDRIANARPMFDSIGLGRNLWSTGTGGWWKKTVLARNQDLWSCIFGEQFNTKLYPDPRSYVTFNRRL